MKEQGKIIGYCFEQVQEGPLSKRLDSNWMIRVVQYKDSMERERMRIFTGSEKEGLLNLQEHILLGRKHREEIEPRISLEQLASEINQLTKSL